MQIDIEKSSRVGLHYTYHGILFLLLLLYHSPNPRMPTKIMYSYYYIRTIPSFYIINVVPVYYHFIFADFLARVVVHFIQSTYIVIQIHNVMIFLFTYNSRIANKITIIIL